MICIFRHHINVDEEVESLSKNYYKVRWTAITNCDSFLIQSATRFITNRDRYYKVRWIYYKLRQVLQSAMIITNCDSTSEALCRLFPTKSKFRQLL